MINNLGDRIREMSEYCECDAISEAVGVPVQIVEGILSGEIPDEALEKFNPNRPPDYRVVEQHKFVRSKVVGVISPGGCGATTITTVAGLLSAQKNKQKTAIIDLNEIPHVGHLTGVNIPKHNKPNYIEDIVHYPIVDNVFIWPGLSDIRKIDSLATVGTQLIEYASKTFSNIWIDCPTSPSLWAELLPKLDLVLPVLRMESTSITSWYRILPLLENHLDKTLIILNMEGQPGNMAAYQCRKLLQGIKEVNIPLVLPFDSNINLTTGKGQCFALSYPNSNFCSEIRNFLIELWPETKTNANNSKGILGTIKKIIWD